MASSGGPPPLMGAARGHDKSPGHHYVRHTAMFMTRMAATVTKNRLASHVLHGPNRGSSTRCQDEIRIGNGF
ncbi:hypothetical protein CFR74_11000 [Novacetimonas hansenii]|nr:hypothetical protein CFR74_11000 [Novacetimonas hansenii]RFP06012.1 hypothetical protein BGC30_13380 [Novacetimonas hansenii]